jgi:hypothetical protein
MPDEWKVVYPQRVLNDFRDVYRLAKSAGLTAEIERAAELIDNHLRSDPTSFGDPCYSLPGMELDLYVRAALVVYYAVNESKQIVFVKRITGLPGLVPWPGPRAARRREFRR